MFVLRDEGVRSINDIVSTWHRIQSDLDVKTRSIGLTTLLDVRLVPSGAITPSHKYVIMMCTGTVVTFYIHRNVICKITGCHLQFYWITMPTHSIYNYIYDRSECNRLFSVWRYWDSADFCKLMTNVCQLIVFTIATVTGQNVTCGSLSDGIEIAQISIYLWQMYCSWPGFCLFEMINRLMEHAYLLTYLLHGAETFLKS